MCGVFQEIARLGGKSHHHARTASLSNFVCSATVFRISSVASSSICGMPPSFLILSFAMSFGRKSATAAAMISASLFADSASTASSICFGGFHVDDLRADRRSQRCGCCDQRDLRAHLQRGLGEGIALFAGGAIGDHAHGVERFLRPSRRDHDLFPGERTVLPEKDADMTDDLRRLEHASHAGKSRGEMSLRRTDEGRAALFQDLDIFLRGGVIVHAAIHGGRDQKRRLHGQRRDRQQGIRLPMRQLGDSIRGAGRNDEKIRGMSQPHMQDMRFIAPEIFVCIGAPARDGLERERGDEFFRRAR